MTHVTVSLDWVIGGLTADVLVNCGQLNADWSFPPQPSLGPFVSGISPNTDYTLSPVTEYPIQTLFGSFSQISSCCDFLYVDESASGQTTLYGGGILQHGVQVLVRMLYVPEFGYEQPWIAVVYAYVGGRVICDGQYSGVTNAFADGFFFQSSYFNAACQNYTTTLDYGEQRYIPVASLAAGLLGLVQAYRWVWYLKATISGHVA